MGNIKFIESTHQYLTEDGREMISVSAFTERFKNKTDWTAIAKRKAAKLRKEGHAISTEELLAKWERKRNISSSIGTTLHTIKENELLEDNNPVFYNTPCSTKQCTFKDSVKYSIPINTLENNTVYPELMIYDHEHMICGQSDKVIVENNTIHIWDYKTDAEIKFKGFSNEWVKAKKMLGPLKHMDECNANIYSIKMSLYMYMLWKANKGKLKPGEIIIEHVDLERDPLDDDIPVLVDGKPIIKGIKQIKLPYRKKEVMAMLETLKIPS